MAPRKQKEVQPEVTQPEAEAIPVVRSDPGKKDEPEKKSPKITNLGGGTVRVDF